MDEQPNHVLSTETPNASDVTPPPPVKKESMPEVQLFRPSTYRFDPRTIQLPDDFFNSTLADVKNANRALSQNVQQLNDAPLMTKKMRLAEEEAKMAKFRKVLIRVLMPDRYSLQGVFKPKSTIREVTKFVNDCLRDPANVQFHLFVVPPKTILKDMKRTLWNEKLVPAAQIMLGVDKGPTETKLLLKDELLALAEDPPAPRVMPAADMPASSSGKTLGSATKSDKGKYKGKIVPKWFKRK